MAARLNPRMRAEEAAAPDVRFTLDIGTPLGVRRLTLTTVKGGLTVYTA